MPMMKSIRTFLSVALTVSGACAVAANRQVSDEFAFDRSVMSDAYWAIWNDAEQARIDADIERYRKADGKFAVDAADGTVVSVEQIEHEFRFGAHIFNFNQLGKTEWNDAYKASYGKGGIFNQATVAYYWKAYEPVPGRLRAGGGYEDTEEYWNSLSTDEAMLKPFWRRPAPGPVVDFLKAKDVRIHGHILIWGSAKPDWIYDWYCPEEEKRYFDSLGIPRHSAHLLKEEAGSSARFGYNKFWRKAWTEAFRKVTEEEVERNAPVFTARMREIFRKRVNDVARDFGAVADSWDVVNESSLDWANYRKSRTGRKVWRSRYGLMPGDYPLHALLDAKAVFPRRAKLAINDYNIKDDFLAQVKDLEQEGARIDIVGCQMHIFATNDCMRLARGSTNAVWVATPGTIANRLDMMARTGKQLHISEVTIAAPGADRRSRDIQAILTRNIYRKWFSHPQVMGITWWNTVDGGGVKGEPLVSGLFTRDMRKKPAYHALDQLINREWMTRTAVPAKDGAVSFRGFRGRYRISWFDAGGIRHEKTVVLTGERSDDLAKPVAAQVFGQREVTELPMDAVRVTAVGFTSNFGVAARRIQSDGKGIFDLVPLLSSRQPEAADSATLTFHVRHAKAGPVRFYRRNDWYGKIAVNGRAVPFAVDGETGSWIEIELNLREGESEIAFTTTPGTSGKWFCALAVAGAELLQNPNTRSQQ